MTELKSSILTVGEFEAIRLKDLESLGQKEAAEKMGISQPTFHRLVLSARKKMADSIVNGKSIKIEGGVYKMIRPKRFERGRKGFGGGGRMGGPLAAGPGGICKCTKCGYEEPQIRGQPCMNKKCPKCQSLMTRG